jgi:hypothetical protein
LEDAELALDAGIIARKAVEVLDDGLAREGIGAALGGGAALKFIEPHEAEVLDGDVIDEQFFLRGLGIILGVEGFPEFFEDGALVAREVHEKEIVRGAQPMLKSIHAGTGFAFVCFGTGGHKKMLKI